MHSKLLPQSISSIPTPEGQRYACTGFYRSRFGRRFIHRKYGGSCAWGAQPFIRYKDVQGKWGIYEGRSFYVDAGVAPQQNAPLVAQAEYFFDTDPGVGNGTPITGFTTADSVDVSFNISTVGLAPGGTTFLSATRMRKASGAFMRAEAFMWMLELHHSRTPHWWRRQSISSILTLG
ncbi:MAG: hypothetical protein H6602_03175 [Flavobacteriales bacterium]|nr:hypothetical protein [Flavobacteriales bacterium]